MADDMVGPALTPEEWAAHCCDYTDAANRVAGSIALEKDPTVGNYLAISHRDLPDGIPATMVVAGERGLRAIAALALHSQPFGLAFERSDVLALEWALKYLSVPRPQCQQLKYLSERIAALLPPRGS